jgi:hypothetical protein
MVEFRANAAIIAHPLLAKYVDNDILLRRESHIGNFGAMKANYPKSIAHKHLDDTTRIVGLQHDLKQAAFSSTIRKRQSKEVRSVDFSDKALHS